MRSWNYYSSLYPNILCNIFGIFWRDFYKTTNICLKADRTAAHPSSNNPVTLAWSVCLFQSINQILQQLLTGWTFHQTTNKEGWSNGKRSTDQW